MTKGQNVGQNISYQKKKHVKTSRNECTAHRAIRSICVESFQKIPIHHVNCHDLILATELINGNFK